MIPNSTSSATEIHAPENTRTDNTTDHLYQLQHTLIRYKSCIIALLSVSSLLHCTLTIPQPQPQPQPPTYTHPTLSVNRTLHKTSLIYHPYVV